MKIDLTGERFGCWLVSEKSASSDRVRWDCICDCGTTKRLTTYQLRSGQTQSCGCMKSIFCSARKTKHGLRFHKEYKRLSNIIQRCENPNNSHYHHYGGRGIKICERWKFGESGKSNIECFIEDMGEPTSDKHSIDRIDVNGDYCKENCKWSNQSEQVKNRRKL